MTDSPTGLERRVVLLGASNLTRGLSIALETVRLILGTRTEVFAALGHGRSYGAASSVIGRTLPGILECGLWNALRERPPAPTYALLTDIGNDIAYGVEAPRLIEWVGQCVDRLGAHEARLIVTLPPLASLRRMRPWQYRLIKAILFPGRPLSFRDAIAQAELLDRGLRELAAPHPVNLVEAPGRWYGFDPIHIRPRHWPEAWERIMRAWTDGPTNVRARGSVRRWIVLKRARPERWSLLGVKLGSRQPAARLPGGTTLWLY